MATPRPKPIRRKVTTLDMLEHATDRLDAVKRLAADERRPHHVTEQMINEVEDISRLLVRAVRG